MRKLPAAVAKKIRHETLSPLSYSVLWFAVGTALLVMFLVSGGNPVNDLLLSHSKLHSQGNVEKIVIRQGFSPSVKQPCRISYNFKVGIDEFKGRCYTFDRQFASRLKAGSRVEVQYLAGSPDISRIVRTRYSIAPVWGIVAALGMMIIGAVILALAVLKYLRVRTVLLYGEKTIGVLNSVKYQRPLNYRKRNLVDTTYIFKDFRGEAVKGRLKTFVDRQSARLKEGDEVDVVYLREKPGKNMSLVNGIKI